MAKLYKFLPVRIFLILFLVFLIFFYAKKTTASNNLYIKDGDSFIWDKKEIRLWGIDAPELFQICQDENNKNYECGFKAKDFLISIIDIKNMKCIEKNKLKSKRESRMVAKCFVGKKDIAEIMVLNGWAIDYKFFSKGAYSKAQMQARKNKKGIWAGSFISPYKWRKQKK